MNLSTRIAGAKPGALLLDSGFWRANASVAAVMFACVLAVLALAPLTYPRGSGAGAWLTLVIHATLLAGFASAGWSLTRIEVDHAIARVVEARASEQLGRIKGRQQERVLLEDLEDGLLPHNPSCATGVLRVLQQVLSEARERRFESALALTQPLRDETIGQLAHVQTVQRIALQLGILGTFAGLVLALSGLSHGGRNLLDPTSVSELCGGLYVSFSSSVAGLEVAISLALVTALLRRRQEAFLRDAESATAVLLSLARNALNRDDFLVEFEQVRAAMRQLSDRVAAQTGEAASVTGAIRTGLDRLAGLRGDFNTFVERVRHEQGLILSEMKSVYAIISPRQVASDIKLGMVEAVTEIGQRLASYAGEIEKLNESLCLVRELGQTFHAQAERQARELEAQRGALAQAVAGVERIHRLQPSAVVAPAQHPATAPRRSAMDELPAKLDRLCAELGRNTFMLGSLVATHSPRPSMRDRIGRDLRDRFSAAGRRLESLKAHLPLPGRASSPTRPATPAGGPSPEHTGSVTVAQ